MLATNYGAGSAQAFADFNALSGVPEPSGLLGILGVTGYLAGRRNRKK